MLHSFFLDAERSFGASFYICLGLHFLPEHLLCVNTSPASSPSFTLYSVKCTKNVFFFSRAAFIRSGNCLIDCKSKLQGKYFCL